MSRRQLVFSGLRTPDGTLLVSTHRHDYVTHKDANGKRYMLDGGLDYVRSSANGDEEYISLYTDSPHEEIRKYATWGTWGKEGEGPSRLVTIRSMSLSHIATVLATQKHIVGRPMEKLMKDEQEYRRN